ncbi:hypothetical protein ACYOEI_25595 [Singulisphaera rosea]
MKGFLTLPPLPQGYGAEVKEMKKAGKIVGHQIFITKKDAVSKVIVTVDEREITSRAAKVATTKGYINGTAKAMGGLGAKLTKKSIPDLDEADFKERFVVDLTYEVPDGGELQLELQVFFGNAGYNILIVGSTPEDFTALVKWAKSIKESSSVDGETKGGKTGG